MPGMNSGKGGGGVEGDTAVIFKRHLDWQVNKHLLARLPLQDNRSVEMQSQVLIE